MLLTVFDGIYVTAIKSPAAIVDLSNEEAEFYWSKQIRFDETKVAVSDGEADIV